MDQHDLRNPDSYAVHLANLNATRAVVATRDIVNEQGVLLVKQGHAIKSDTVQRLLNHKLVAPLETSVNVADAIDANRLFADITALIATDEECRSLQEALNLDGPLKALCRLYAGHSLIAQKITVLSARLKDEYQKALFCAWFAWVMARQMGNQAISAEDAFIAGLTHDTGLLHIAPEIVLKQGVYTPEEWRALQSHTLVAEAFLKYVEGLSKEVLRAVREHHERCDGTGYPVGLFGEKLGLLGQVVAMADIVWATCKKPGGKQQSLADVMTLIRMNKAQHPGSVDAALYLTWRDAGARPSQSLETPPGSDELVRAGERLQAQYRLVYRLRGMLPADHKDRTIRSAQIRLDRLCLVVNASGLLTESIANWLRSSEAGKRDVHELSLMYGELQWQLFQLERTLQQVLSRPHDLDAKTRHAIQSVLKALEPLVIRNRYSSLLCVHGHAERS